MQLTAADLRRLAPHGRADLIDAIVAGWPAAVAAGIKSPRRTHHLLAQILTETGGLRVTEENLNYSVERLMEVWPRRFPTAKAAAPYAHNPQALAEKTYGSRMGNGKPGSGDGWKYRGRGLMQNTGREGYREAGYEDNPEALLDPAIGFAAAVREFVNSGCLVYADRDDVYSVRKLINVGSLKSPTQPNGMTEAREWLAKCKMVLVDRPDAAPDPVPIPRPKPEVAAPAAEEVEDARPVAEGVDDAAAPILPPATPAAPAIDVPAAGPAPVPADTGGAPLNPGSVAAETDMPARPGVEILKRSKTVWGSITGTFSAGGAGYTVKSIIDSPQGPIIIGIAAAFILIAGGALLLIFRDRVRKFVEWAV